MTDDSALELENPETWPTDLTGLAGLADEPPADGEAKATTETPAQGDAADADARNGVEDLAAGKERDPAGVLTRDGKHVIPYEVLRSERDARKGLETQTAALEAEIAALKAAAVERGTTPATTTAAPEGEGLPAEVKAKADELRENFGDEFADQWLDNWHLKNEVAGMKRSMQAIESERGARETATRETEQESIQQAIDAVPLLAEWQADSANPEWYQRANELHQVLIKSNPAYSAMSWAERMETLPGKVEAVYGESPQSARTKAATTAGKAAAFAVSGATIRRPASMSDIPGGEPLAQSETERLETLSPAQLQATITAMAAKGTDGLESFLRGL